MNASIFKALNLLKYYYVIAHSTAARWKEQINTSPLRSSAAHLLKKRENKYLSLALSSRREGINTSPLPSPQEERE